MSALVEETIVTGVDVTVSEDTLTLDLSDGRTISVPLAWHPRLLYGTVEERTRWEWIGENEGVHWPDLDEDISVDGIIAGRRPVRASAHYNGSWNSALCDHSQGKAMNQLTDGWPELTYRHIEHYFWEPQHLLLRKDSSVATINARGESKIERAY